ncbi:hypothetical protein NC652_039306 [Populus alba x Populus x berolinensis]|nr:hypothetical protein NC652_039306 [Populus alba x Populus x berolinensis]
MLTMLSATWLCIRGKLTEKSRLLFLWSCAIGAYNWASTYQYYRISDE